MGSGVLRHGPLPTNLLLSAAVSALFLGLLEIGARLVEKRRPALPVAAYIWNWEEMWEGDFYRIRSEVNGWPPWEEFNADGLRDRTHAEEKPSGMMRLVFLGDSVTAGAQIEEEEAFPEVLQARLDEEGRPVEVFNAALRGWSTRQERIAYERIARKYHPDEVVLAVCLNDIPELQDNLTRPPRLVSALYRRSALVRVVINAEDREIRSVEQLFVEPDSKSVKEGMARFFDEVRTLRSEVRADAASFSLLVLPFRFQVMPHAPRPVVQERISAFCAAEGLTCLDLLPAIRDMGQAAFVDYDHLSPQGARLVANIIAGSALLRRAPPACRVPAEAVVARLVTALSDRDPEVRRCAVRALGRPGSAGPSAVRFLEAALRDPAESVRREAVHTLGQMGEASRPAVPALFASLCDERASVRWQAALSLSALDLAPDSVPALVAALRNDDGYVRGFAAWTLGSMGEAARDAVPALVDSLLREEGYERGGAAAALAKMRSAAAAAVPALLDGLRSADGDRRWKAARTLGRIGPAAAAAVPALTLALTDPDEYVRAHAARALGRLGLAADPAVPALEQAARDPDKNVRKEAHQALEHLSSRR
ncbi:MAG TPA: HEAT repeat domain-containing protein [Vicinamibacteria bacterium]